MAVLMQADLSGLKDESLDHIDRRMHDIERRLDLGRAGKKVRSEEDGIIASLDKLIEQKEKEEEEKSGGGGSGPARASNRRARPRIARWRGRMARAKSTRRKSAIIAAGAT